MIYTTTPYHHQDEALNIAWGKRGYAYFLEQGTGKSKIIIDEIVNLIEQDRINVAIVLAPNNVHINWAREFEKHGPPNYNKWKIQIWKSKSKEKFEEETRTIIESGKVLIFLMNIEALSSDTGKIYLDRIMAARRRSYLVIDESHKIKTPGAKRTKNAIDLGKKAMIRRISTGTEAEEGIENLFSQFRFLDPNIIGLRSFTSFRSMFCIMGGYEGREIKGYQNQEILAQRIAPYTYQKRKKECLDLPDKVYVTHEIGMTLEQLRIYNELEDKLIYELNSGAIVDVTMAMTRMMRLQQILCGHINSSDEEYKKYPELIPSARADFVTELVEEASGKVIVFCRFIKDVELVISSLASANIRGVGVSSHVPSSERMMYIDRWRQEKQTQVLAITTATGGTGLTLNEAATTIFYSNSWSGTDRIQAEDRNHRIGQDSKVTYHDIIVPHKIDHRLLRVLKSKQHDAAQFRSIIDIQRFLAEEI